MTSTETCTVTIDHRQTFEQIVAAGDYDPSIARS
jgi:hypothetical protein